MNELMGLISLALIGYVVMQGLNKLVGWGNTMGLNNATVIIVLREHASDAENYYLKQIFNPDSVISHPDSFASFIYNSEVFINRKKAIEEAQALEFTDPTSNGILIYDALSSFTFGDFKELLSKREEINVPRIQ